MARAVLLPAGMDAWDTVGETAAGLWDSGTSAVKGLWDRVTTPVADQETAVAGQTDVPIGSAQGEAGTNVDASGRPVGYQAKGSLTDAPGAPTSYPKTGSTTVNGVPVSGSATAQTPTANAGVGSFTDASGKQSTGARAEATSAKVEGQAKVGAPGGPQGTVGAEASGPSAWIGASDNGSTFEAGASAQAAGGSVNAGTSGTSSDEHVKVGVSEGAGAAARFHHGDEDDDGRKEWGVGVDVGPVGVDVKTEDPLRTFATTANPFMWPIGAAARVAEGVTGTDVNWTEAAGGAVDKVGEVAGGALVKASDLFNDLF